MDGINIGLFIEEDLCQLLALVELSSGIWEITIFSSVLGVIIENGFNRIWEFFLSKYNPNTVVFKIDKRLFSGKYLLQYGFILAEQSVPTCWYFQDNKQSILISSQYQTKCIKLFDDNVECSEHLKSQKYNRIWDCGHEIWKWTNNH